MTNSRELSDVGRELMSRLSASSPPDSASEIFANNDRAGEAIPYVELVEEKKNKAIRKLIATSEIARPRERWASKAARLLASRKLPQPPTHTEQPAPAPRPTEGLRQSLH
jgi:hypothetical protein